MKNTEIADDLGRGSAVGDKPSYVTRVSNDRRLKTKEALHIRASTAAAEETLPKK